MKSDHRRASRLINERIESATVGRDDRDAVQFFVEQPRQDFLLFRYIVAVGGEVPNLHAERCGAEGADL